MISVDEHLRSIREDLDQDEVSGSRATPRARPVILLDDVRLTFDQPVLTGASMLAHASETVMVAGESGTGKSTILKLILRLLVPDAGRIIVLGRDVVHLTFKEVNDLRRTIGMVFQNAALFDSLSIYENVAYPLRENTELTEPEIDRVVRERLDFVDLDPDRVMDHVPSQLSGGMRKRVGIARAIATDPSIVLYDEPTTGLDPLTANTILALIRKLQRELGVTSLVVTHDVRAGFRVANRVYLLRSGCMVFEGTPEQMVTSADPYIRAFLS